MNIQLLPDASNSYTLPQSGHSVLIIGGRRLITHLLTQAARMALIRPISILDGGNHSNPYLLAAEIRRQGADPNIYLKNISITRAFSSVQFLSMAQKAARSMAQAGDCITIVLDALLTFYDESLPRRESERLLNLSIQSLRIISRHVPLIIQVVPLTAFTAGKQTTFNLLYHAFPNVLIEPAPAANTPTQPNLF